MMFPTKEINCENWLLSQHVKELNNIAKIGLGAVRCHKDLP